MALGLAVLAIVVGEGCAARARGVGFEVAAPLEMEKGSYGASQRDYYNRIYARGEKAEANEFLVECLERIAKGKSQIAKSDRARGDGSGDLKSEIGDLKSEIGKTSAESAEGAGDALDVAMGDGRNTIALARRGYRVVGFDFSDVGVNRARRRAAELGLAIDARVDYFGEAYFPEERWDVVALMYFSVDSNGMEKIKRSVKRGGYVILESAGMWPENGLLREFLDWEVVVYEAGWGGRDWAARQPEPGDGVRTRVLARRR